MNIFAPAHDECERDDGPGIIPISIARVFRTPLPVGEAPEELSRDDIEWLRRYYGAMLNITPEDQRQIDEAEEYIRLFDEQHPNHDAPPWIVPFPTGANIR